MGISITELTVIFLVALVLFGPEQLPVLARTVGKLTGQVKRTSDSLRREFYNSVYPPGEDIKNSLNGELRSLRALKTELLSPPAGAVGSPSRPTASQQPERQPSETQPSEAQPAETSESGAGTEPTPSRAHNA